MEEALYLGETTEGLYIRATGHITAGLCAELKASVFSRLDKSDALIPGELVMDLSECDYMDSTFMGLIVGFNKRFKVVSGHTLQVLNPSQECLKLLTSLGIVKLLEIVDNPSRRLPGPLTKLTKGEKPSADLLLKAHQNLSELSAENEKKFSVLQEILKKQLESGN